MIHCLPDETGTRCRWCGWEWKRPGKFPRRDCPDAPGAKEAARQRIVAEMERQAAEGKLPRTPEDVATTLDLCFSGNCDWLQSNTCVRRGSGPCTKRKTWIQFIACSPCDCETDETKRKRPDAD